MSSPCERARRTLWPPEQPRLAEHDVVEARAHVERCDACRDYLEQDRLLLAALDRARRIETPGRVRERVFDALARERAGVSGGPTGSARTVPSLGRRLLGGGLAIAAVLLVAVGLEVAPSGPAPKDARDVFLEDYLRRAVGEDHIVTSDPDEVGRFLMRELGMPLHPLVADGLSIEKAEICLLDGRRGAMIVYKRGGRTLSHYLIPGEPGEVRTPSPDPELGRALEGGPAVVTWTSAGVQQALVGEGEPGALVRLVEGSRAGRRTGGGNPDRP